MERQQILDRIHECETILKEFDDSKLWAIIKTDMERSKGYLDDNWQNVKSTDSEKLTEMRVAKLSVSHILQLPLSYQKDLDNARKALAEIDNTDSEIPKDYDLETTVEKGKPEGGDYGSR